MISSTPHFSTMQGKLSKRRQRVLLGVTGSVAAVKSPEIAVRLARDEHFDICVLLTAGGLNFWTKAQEYNPSYWQELEKRIVTEEITTESSGIEGQIFIRSE
jgi:phosphopantothenoylcysteine synthetase/decarboxylase